MRFNDASLRGTRMKRLALVLGVVFLLYVIAVLSQAYLYAYKTGTPILPAMYFYLAAWFQSW